ncbi:hypothetical protein Baya_15318 [Bagarius yarrelli]|uniref:Uncharacterized protein n=1 Tax=Bagarius yarrelli TaxID=175774 RepID=A0A556VBE1_BAGYA|nr:hypothetical protein Baya_15318 [Bagarius yarrelli]
MICHGDYDRSGASLNLDITLLVLQLLVLYTSFKTPDHVSSLLCHTTQDFGPSHDPGLWTMDHHTTQDFGPSHDPGFGPHEDWTRYTGLDLPIYGLDNYKIQGWTVHDQRFSFTPTYILLTFINEQQINKMNHPPINITTMATNW